MKKFIFIMIALLAFMVVGVQAQATKVKTLASGQWYFTDANNVSLATSGDSVLLYTITLNKADDILYDIKLKLDSVSGTPDYDIDLKSRVFTTDAWADLETDVTWDGTSADTAILFQEHSTAVFARQLQVQVNGQALTGAAALDLLEIKIWP